jgi:hypothetical protein
MLHAADNSGAGKAPHPCGGGKFLPGTRLRSFFAQTGRQQNGAGLGGWIFGWEVLGGDGRF